MYNMIMCHSFYVQPTTFWAMNCFLSNISTSTRKEIEQFHIFLCMQNTRAIGEGKTLKINPEIRVLVHVDCLVRDGKPGSPAISNLLKSLCPPYRSIDLHLQFLSIFLQPLYQFGQWNSTVLLLVFILSCFGLTSEKKEGVSKSRGNKSFIIDVLCELDHFRGFLLFDSSTWFSGFQFCSDENSINWIDWFKCCNYCNQSNHFPLCITWGIISGCLAVNLSKLLLDWSITKCNVYTVNIIWTRSNCQRSLSDEGKKYVPLPISLLPINERRTTGVRKHFPCWRTFFGCVF